MKTHDWHTFIKVIHVILYSLYICIVHVVLIAFFYKILISILPLSLLHFDNSVKQVIYDLGKYLRWLSSKEINKEDIKYWKRKIPLLMCEMQKFLPSSFFNAQDYYLIHQVEEIELCVPIQVRSMWMIETHLKFMNGLV